MGELWVWLTSRIKERVIITGAAMIAALPAMQITLDLSAEKATAAYTSDAATKTKSRKKGGRIAAASIFQINQPKTD